MEFCIIKCTTPDIETAEKIAKSLVEGHFAACINIIPKIKSFYIWEEKLNCDTEVLLIIKTKTSLFERVEAEIKKLHPYKVPEIIALPIIKGNGEYLGWINEQTAF